MAKKDLYSTSFVLNRNREEDVEVITKLQNRDKYKYHSIPAYLRAAVLAFDDKNPRIIYSGAAKKDLLNEIKEQFDESSEVVKKDLLDGIKNQFDDMKYYFVEEVITKFGE